MPSRYDESDEESILTVNYAGFTPLLVEGLKELEQQQEQDVDNWKEVAHQQSLELGEAQEEIESLKELARQQSLALGVAQREIDSLKELAGQLLQSYKEQQIRFDALFENASQQQRN